MRTTMILLGAVLLPVSVGAQTGTITGTVTAGADGAPIASAVISLVDPHTRLSVFERPTNASGVYSLNVPVGTYSVTAAAPGFVREVYPDIPCVSADCIRFSFLLLRPVFGGLGTLVTVTPGASMTLDFALERGRSIRGTATRASNGTAISRLAIVLYNEATSKIATAFTDAAGAFQFDGLPQGNYFARTEDSQIGNDFLDRVFGGPVCPVWWGNPTLTGSCRVDLGAPITITTSSSTVTANVSLDPAGSIAGTISWPGQTLNGISVAVYAGSHHVSTVTPDLQGRYLVQGLGGGSYFVRTISTRTDVDDVWYDTLCVSCLTRRNPTPVVVHAGATTSGIDIQLASLPGTISGTLTLETVPGSEYIPVKLPSVLIYREDGALARTVPLGEAGSFRMTPGPQAGGMVPWSASGLPVGTYYVRTSNPVSVIQFPLWAPHRHSGSEDGFWVDKLFDNIVCVAEDCAPTRGTPVVLSLAAPSAVVNLSLDLGGTITGKAPTYTFAQTGPLDIYDGRGVPLPGRIIAGHSSSGYVARGLPAGAYYLRVRREPKEGAYAARLYRDVPCDGCAITSGTPVSVELREARSDVDFGNVVGRMIRGIVRSSAAAPLSTITVSAYTSGGELVASSLSTADGYFDLPNMVPATYELRTTNARGYGDATLSVTVAAGADTNGVELTLPAGTTVSGSVQAGDDRAPLEGVGVGVFTPAGIKVAHAVTDPLGRYSVTVAPGTYRAATDAFPGYHQKLYDNKICPFGTCAFATGTPIVVGAGPLTGISFLLTSCGAGTIAPVALANAAVGSSYRQTIAGTVQHGGTPVVSIAGGTLPPGLSFDSATGVLSGTPTSAGSYTFTVAVSDQVGCAGTRTYTLDIPACVLNVAGTAVSRASGEPMLVPVTTNCASWSVSSNVLWLSIQQVPATNPTGVLIVASPNTATTPRTGTVTMGSRILTVYQNGMAPQPPFGVLETPANGAVIAGSVAIGGWALDDLAIHRVAIYRDPVAGEGATQVYLGDATIVPGARPDVEAAFPAVPNNTRAGYGYLLLSNMLPNGGNGTFNLYAYADDIDGNRVLLGARTVAAVNATSTAPFGAIDTPDQGAIISGQNYVNFGWALTPQPKLIPFDGSTISVVIDGVPVGTLSGYNFARSDVASLFPGLKNSAGAVGYRVIDTTALSEGIHTLSWVVTDDAGQSTGIGSRYFTVQNSAWVPSLKMAPRITPPAFTRDEVTYADATTAMPPRIDGPDIHRKTASLLALPVDALRDRAIELNAQQRLKLALTPPDETCGATYEGYLSAHGELRAMPIGSSLDRRGTFYWQPGPAFRGTYQLLFVRTLCGGARTRIPVAITIR